MECNFCSKIIWKLEEIKYWILFRTIPRWSLLGTTKISLDKAALSSIPIYIRIGLLFTSIDVNKFPKTYLVFNIFINIFIK